MVKNISAEKLKTVNSVPKILKKHKHKKKTKISISELGNVEKESQEMSVEKTKQHAAVQKTAVSKTMLEGMSEEEIGNKYPILTDMELVQRFLSVPMNNNQKGRVRQVLRDKLKDTSDSLLPDVIYDKIQLILKSSENLTDTDLRKIRILYNMLKTAVQNHKKEEKVKKVDKVIVEKKLLKDEKDSEKLDTSKEKKQQLVKKVKGKKRYVVFLGNLPLDIDKEKIMKHFSEVSDHIVDVRIPKLAEGKKSAIAYVELKNEPTYELALSKHHSMLGTKRINVLYTAQKNGKITKAEAKSKSAKLLALQKSGKLIGSMPLNRKRSHRRTKMKQARAKEMQNQ
ncbi:nucleolin-like [Galleria mellonella]|uniref:Nucleolin-like n=1 Tax=Galleria mellonella TaxID=7137 RepID=A0A6J3CDC1_GALME|nr:nucleolin-like [Galleria mellonella]